MSIEPGVEHLTDEKMCWWSVLAMGDHIDFRPQARVDGLVSETVDDGLVVYDTTNCVAHALAAEAASVWGRCDGTRSPAEIARELGMEGDRVDSAISELGRCGLLEAPSQAPPRFSRREAGAKLGKAAVLGPLIVSLAIPTPAAAASPTTCPAGARPGARCLPERSGNEPFRQPGEPRGIRVQHQLSDRRREWLQSELLRGRRRCSHLHRDRLRPSEPGLQQHHREVLRGRSLLHRP